MKKNHQQQLPPVTWTSLVTTQYSYEHGMSHALGMQLIDCLCLGDFGTIDSATRSQNEATIGAGQGLIKGQYPCGHVGKKPHFVVEASLEIASGRAMMWIQPPNETEANPQIVPLSW